MASNNGQIPGVVEVPSETKGSSSNAPSDGTSTFGEPSRTANGAPGAMVGKDNTGDAPGVVTVPRGTQGDQPANHPGKPGDAGQGHSKYSG